MEALLMNHRYQTTPPVRQAATRPAQASRSTSEGVAPPPHLPRPRSLRDRDDSDPNRCMVELVQRGRLILDVSVADLETAEAKFGAFHPTTWYFRNALSEAQHSWERLYAELGKDAIKAALEEPPLTALTVGEPANELERIVLILIGGQTYRPQRVAGTELAPIQWQLTRLIPPLENGPYYVCRLADGSTQCDCADWTYQINQSDKSRRTRCKHLAALAALTWI